jgi:Histidine kinase-, DNA gyrase B-, and HSP90-like ATPase
MISSSVAPKYSSTRWTAGPEGDIDYVNKRGDSGPGIDPERLDRVFDAFYTTRSNGVGMGLSICRSIVYAHGGPLWADVNTPRGAVFRFTLPGADNELTNSFRPAQLTREPRGDTVSDTAHLSAYEGNKRPHRSGRGRVPRRRGRQ